MGSAGARSATVVGTDELLNAQSLAAAYRRRKDRVSPVDVVRQILGRIDQHDVSVRSYVVVDAENALAQAKRAEARIARGDTSPMLGVPVSVKDLIDVGGLATTAGSRVLADNVPERDATVVAKLKRAGAVIIGKVNTHEFAYGGLTDPTRNPWNLDHMVGGSSGGPAAALAAGLCTVSVGSDTAGSIRIPAGLCGVWGLKPTQGSVSSAGVIPLSPSLDVVGPMGHHPADLACALGAMTGRDVSAQFSAAVSKMRRRTTSKRLRIGVLDQPGGMTPALGLALESMRTAWSKAGADFVTVSFPGFVRSVFVNFTILGVEAARWHVRYADKAHLYTDYVRERLAEAAATTAVDYLGALDDAITLRHEVDAMLSDCDAVLMPGIPFAAPKVGETVVRVGDSIEDRDLGLCRNTGFANVTGHPVLAIPAGFEDGLPVGVQLLGSRGADADILAIAHVMHPFFSAPTIPGGFT